jgi:flagellar basal-body rod modification protein FlgD
MAFAIPPTTATPATPSLSSTGAAKPAATANLDREAFLKLLVAQLKYQDPSKPMDASEMVSQSAQLSVVDKLSEIATSLNDSRAASRLSLAGSVIGTSVTFTATDGTSKTAVVTGVAFDGNDTVLKAGTTSIPLGAVTSLAAQTN